MIKQLVFLFILLLTLGCFTVTVRRITRYFKLTRPAFPVRNIAKRIRLMLEVAFCQSKIFRRPLIGLLHALVFWGFCVILTGSIEMIIDGLAGTERVLSVLGPLYGIITASGDIFAFIVGVAIIIFLIRRLFIPVKRFQGIEMKKVSHLDADIALSMILILMISLLGMNAAYAAMPLSEDHAGIYPLGQYFCGMFSSLNKESVNCWYQAFWWIHILVIFLFINILPYSKHFHVFMSVPNVFLSRLEPLGKLSNMDNITREVRLMLDPSTAFESFSQDIPLERFGIKDVEDASWKNYLDSLSCTECGRCTSVCPANLTGKRLTPRKILMDLRARMKDKGPGLVANGKEYTDNKSLMRDYITEEELWACTTCNACAQECPININHPSIIVDMRRYLVMEEASAPGELKSMFNYIENNGAPWQFSAEDRLLWAKDLEINTYQHN
jgi:heterodisulfide reductase subunit C/nitrate reductase gamma subunit